MAIKEATEQARVPTQLVSPDNEDNEEEGKEECGAEEDEVQEFSAAGAVAGYALPLGMDPDKSGRKKNSSKK